MSEIQKRGRAIYGITETAGSLDAVCLYTAFLFGYKQCTDLIGYDPLERYNKPKVCTTCKVSKAPTEFYKRNPGPVAGLKADCKKCCCTKSRDRHARGKKI